MNALGTMDTRLRSVESTTKWWWVFLVTGILWLIVSRFDIQSVGAVGVLIACLVVVAFMTKSVNELWWLNLIAGAAEILLAFWAAGYFGRKTILLIAWEGA